MIQKHVLQRLGLTALLAAATACDRAVTPTSAVQAGDPGPRLVRAESAIPGRYVVVFKRDRVASSPQAARAIISEHGGRLHHTFQHSIQGFAAALSPEAVQALLDDPQVAYVAEDGMMSPSVTQSPVTWGLDRIDQRPLPLSNSYTYTPTGAGVRAYVIDSGILTAHTQFGGRASVGVDFIGDGQNGQDCNGHGTHVAGTIGGSTYGVAKAVSLVSVRVFGCSGGTPNSTIMAAVDWVTANAVKPAVVNMSLGGGYYQPLNDAVTASIASGITYAIAAGNEDVDACDVSPASTPGAITVASSTFEDVRSDFSNWGSCTDLFAPGSDITSAWWTGTSDVNTISGTSMATPHVAGVVALYLQGNPTATPAAVTTAVLNSASSGRISDLKGTPNLLLYSPLTAEALRLSTTTLNVTTLRSPGSASAPAAGAGGPVTFTASGAGGTKPTRAARADGADQVVTTSSVVTRTVSLTNTTGGAMSWTSSSSQPWLTLSPASGTLAASTTQGLTVNLNTTGLANGSYSGTITVTGGGVTTVLSVSLTVADGVVLTSGVALTNLSGDSGFRYFMISVPEGADSLRIAMNGPNGDADLYVRRGALPTDWEYDCGPYLSGSVESCFGVAPAGGDYFIGIDAWLAYTGLSLVATVYGAPEPPPAATIPAAATDVVARGGGTGKVNVLWTDNSDNEERFRVRRALRNPDGTFGTYFIIGNRGPNNGSFVDSTVAIGSTYRYQIQTCNVAGCSYSASSAAIDVKLPPTAPSGVAGVVEGGNVNVSWTDNSGTETQFRVRRATRQGDGSFGAYVQLKALGANVTTYADTSAAEGATYRYQIQACNSGGCTSSAAATVSVPTRPLAPTGVTAQATSGTTVSLGWTDASTNESAFLVRRALRGAGGVYGPYSTVDAVAARTTSHVDGTASPGQTYRYQVQACNASGCSSSGAVTVSTPGS